LTRTVGDTWKRILKGDTEAWEELVDHYSALVYSVARNAGLSSSDADDCFQQTWLALYQGRDNIRKPNQLPSWLISTARHKALNMSRARARNVDMQGQLTLSSRVEQPDQILERLQSQAQLELALEQLDKRCYLLLHAIFFSHRRMSYKDIATMLDITINSLGATRARCLSKLKKILEKTALE
jgi:RNA polymerase sigma factor (sigma-70 family)